MDRTVDEIAAKMDALGLWSAVAPYNWAVRPRGTAFPYFCTAVPGENPQVKIRFLMLEGWQTLHDFVRTRVDPNYGFYLSPMELPHFELVFPAAGGCGLFRHDPCYIPRPANESERAFCARVLWESYGMMLRIESEARLPLRYAAQNAMFARTEDASGAWSDEALAIPRPQPPSESVAFSKADLAAAKDLPFAGDEALAVDFGLLVGSQTQEARPRCVYQLTGLDAKTGQTVFADLVSPHPDGGIKAMWERVPPRILRQVLSHGRIPGEIMVRSQRLFRLMRPLCIDIPFRLSLHGEFPKPPSAP